LDQLSARNIPLRVEEGNRDGLAAHPVPQLQGQHAPGDGVHRSGSSISLSLSGNDSSALTTYFNKLAAGGTVTMPLEKAPWGDTFGMCTDKFGVQWMVNITASESP